MAYSIHPTETENKLSNIISSACGGGSAARALLNETTYVQRASSAPFPDPNWTVPQQVPYRKGATTVRQDPAVSSGGSKATPISCYGHVSDMSTAAINDAIPIADQLVLNKLASLETNDFNLGVALGEMKETVGLIGSTAFRLAGAFRSLKRFDLKSAARYLSLPSVGDIRNPRRSQTGLAFASSAWLELVFGWRPMLSDIYSASSKAAELMSSRNDDIKVVSSYTHEFDENLSGGNWISASSRGSVRVGYVYYLTVVNSNLRLAASLGLTNPVNVAWQLLPFSFVVDWFYPIGSYLERMSAFHGFGVAAASRTILVKETGSGTCKPPWGGTGHTNGTYHRSQWSFKREIQFPAPTANLRSLPRLGNKLDTNRAITSLALLKQVFGR